MLDRETYQQELQHYQQRLAQLSEQQRRPVIVVCEGLNAADCPTIIDQITEHLDPGGYVVHRQSEANNDHHYLYPFWRRLPACGQTAFFHQSWYRRVLSDRAEGLCTEEQWTRAYREINAFERQLANFGTILVKCWIHVTLDDSQPSQCKAIDEMLLQTSTLTASWSVVDGDDPLLAQIKTIMLLVDILAKESERQSDNKKRKSKSKSKAKSKKKKKSKKK